nr:MAG TPA: hypothetical protein [Caudoviricetes sp.]
MYSRYVSVTDGSIRIHCKCYKMGFCIICIVICPEQTVEIRPCHCVAVMQKLDGRSATVIATSKRSGFDIRETII